MNFTNVILLSFTFLIYSMPIAAQDHLDIVVILQGSKKKGTGEEKVAEQSGFPKALLAAFCRAVNDDQIIIVSPSVIRAFRSATEFSLGMEKKDENYIKKYRDFLKVYYGLKEDEIGDNKDVVYGLYKDEFKKYGLPFYDLYKKIKSSFHVFLPDDNNKTFGILIPYTVLEKTATTLEGVGLSKDAKKVQSFTQQFIEKPEADVEVDVKSLVKIFQGEKNKEKRIYIVGHGSPPKELAKTMTKAVAKKAAGSLVGLMKDDYQTLIKNFNSLGVTFLYLESCYGGGWNALSFNEGIETNYPIVLGSLTDVAAKFDYKAVNFNKFFNKINIFFTSKIKWEDITDVVWKKLLDTITGKRSVNLPTVRLSGQDYFRPLDIDDRIHIIRHPLPGGDTITIKNQDLLLLAPSVIEKTIKIEGEHLPNLVSIIPGPAHHYIKNITVKPSARTTFASLFSTSNMGESNIFAKKSFYVETLVTSDGTLNHVFAVTRAGTKTEVNLYYQHGDSWQHIKVDEPSDFISKDLKKTVPIESVKQSIQEALQGTQLAQDALKFATAGHETDSRSAGRKIWQSIFGDHNLPEFLKPDEVTKTGEKDHRDMVIILEASRKGGTGEEKTVDEFGVPKALLLTFCRAIENDVITVVSPAIVRALVNAFNFQTQMNKNNKDYIKKFKDYLISERKNQAEKVSKASDKAIIKYYNNEQLKDVKFDKIYAKIKDSFGVFLSVQKTLGILVPQKFLNEDSMSLESIGCSSKAKRVEGFARHFGVGKDVTIKDAEVNVDDLLETLEGEGGKERGIYLVGHGQPPKELQETVSSVLELNEAHGRFVGLVKKDYQKFIQNLQARYLYVETCYGGGWNSVAFHDKILTSYPILLGSLTEMSSSLYYKKINFDKFFSSISELLNTSKDLSLVPMNKWKATLKFLTAEKYENQPYLRLPGAEYFKLLDIDDSVYILRYPLPHDDTIVLKDQSLLLLAPTVIDKIISIEGTKIPNLISIIPGVAHHYIKEMKLQTTFREALSDLFSTSHIDEEVIISKRAFYIRKMQIKQDDVKIDIEHVFAVTRAGEKTEVNVYFKLNGEWRHINVDKPSDFTEKKKLLVSIDETKVMEHVYQALEGTQISVDALQFATEGQENDPGKAGKKIWESMFADTSLSGYAKSLEYTQEEYKDILSKIKKGTYKDDDIQIFLKRLERGQYTYERLTSMMKDVSQYVEEFYDEGDFSSGGVYTPIINIFAQKLNKITKKQESSVASLSQALTTLKEKLTNLAKRLLPKTIK